MPSAKTVFADHVAWRRVDTTAVLLNLESSEYFTANTSAAMILELISEGRSANEIVEALCSEFSVAKDRVQADLKKFQSALARQGFIREVTL